MAHPIVRKTLNIFFKAFELLTEIEVASLRSHRRGQQSPVSIIRAYPYPDTTVTDINHHKHTQNQEQTAQIHDKHTWTARHLEYRGLYMIKILQGKHRWGGITGQISHCQHTQAYPLLFALAIITIVIHDGLVIFFPQ